jgi:hypothetical protein
MTSTSLYKNLCSLRDEYANRIEGTHLPAWKEHWVNELQAVLLAISALEAV